MTYTLNVRFLVKLLVVLAVVVGAVHFWHRRQASKEVEFYRRLAEAAKDDRKVPEESRYLERYLQLRPHDVDARERLGRIRYETAKTNAEAVAAFLILEDALRRDDGRHALRRFLVDVALDPRLQLIPEARGHLTRLQKDLPPDGDVEGLLALCHQAQEEFVLAAQGYETSIGLKPDRLESYVRLAVLLRRLPGPAVDAVRAGSHFPKAKDPKTSTAELADWLIAELVARNGANFRAHLAAAEYWRAFGHSERVYRFVADAVRLAPDEADVILAFVAAQRDLARALRAWERIGHLTSAVRGDARTQADRGLRLHPRLPAMHQARADIELDVGRLDEAEAILQAGAEALPAHADLWLALADIKVRRNDPEGADRALARVRELDTPPPVIAYQAARVEILRENWLQAATLLSRARDDLAGTPYVKPANFLLARCYEQIGELDRRVEAFGRVVADRDTTDPLWAPATRGLAEARADMGQTDAALELYRTLAARDRTAWLAIARIRLGQAARAPGDKPDLRPVEEALRQAAGAVPDDTTELVLLRGDLLNLQQAPAAARKLLTDHHRAKGEKDLDVWIALAVQDFREHDPNRAGATLDEARQKLGDSVPLRLARARFLLAAKAPDLDRQLRALGPADGDAFARADRLRLARGLAELAAATGAGDAAADLWARAADIAPQNLAVQLHRFDRALQAQDVSAAEQVLAQIQVIDGANGTSYRAARAFFLLHRLEKDPSDTAARDEAGRLFEALENERPGWARVALGQAVLAELFKDSDRALSLYERAIDQGERDPAVIRHMVQMMYARGRSAEASAAMAKLPPSVLETAEVSRLATEVSLLSKRPDQALRHIDRAANPDSADYRDQLWRARVFWAAGAREKWEAPLRKAVAGAKGDPVPFVTLVEFLTVLGRRPEAEKAISEFADTVALDQRALAKAQCYQLVGDTEKTQHFYDQALREQGQDIRVLRGYGEFLMWRGKGDDFKEAEKVWARVNNLRDASPEDKVRVGQMIAVCVSMTKDYRAARDALAAIGLVEQGRLKSPTEDMKPPALRAAATALAIQVDRASKVEAIRYLERLEVVLGGSGQTPTAADRFLRAQLHAALNDLDAVRTQMRLVLMAAPDNPMYLAFHLGILIRQQRPDLLAEAERRLLELKKVQAEAPRTFELEARLAAARKKPEEAHRVLAALEGRADVRPGPLAALYEELGLYDDASRLYQQVAEQDKRPEALLPYAVFLGRRQETEKALARCEEARRGKCSPVALTGAGVSILYAAREPRPADMARVLGWITEAIQALSGQPAAPTADLLNRQAAVLNLQGKYEDAIAVYERLLQLNPRDAVAMNNLAYLLAAHRKQFDPALEWLRQAKGVVGPLPELLDTEALVHLAKARTESADAKRQSIETSLALLGDVEVQAPNATAYFHLAQARLAAGKRTEALRAWEEAGKRKLTVADLHPLERKDHDDLRTALGG